MKDRHLSSFRTRDLIVIHWMEKMVAAFGVMSAAQVRHLPVVDDGGGIIGIISDRDFKRAMQIDQPDFISGKVVQPEFDPNARVRDFMSWPVAALPESATIADAARAMIDQKISSLVVTKSSKVIGIVTTEDLLRALIEGTESALGETAKDIEAAVYNSPIGPIAHALANIGL